MKKNPLKLLWLLLGLVCLGLGCVGVVLPIIPSVPFFPGYGSAALPKARKSSTTGS